ncbi:MAG: (d)CMP kinase [Lachnospiraceae bacterium]|nr:(d)CMP kinase [Lachnospiraceae bacterium]
MGFNVAIDGPAGAGKSTIAKAVAAKLGFIYVDTGAMYRAIALYLLNHNIASDDEKAIEESLDDINVEIAYVDGSQQVLLNGDNVSKEIRREEVGNMASATSVYGCVRSKLLSLQRELARKSDVIMDGRDIGTCVLPDAQVKIYLTASVDCRAQRRYKELVEKGETPVLEDIKKDISDRDYRDMHRDIAPLKQADDAVCVDSSDMTIQEVVDTIVGLCEK